MIFILDNYDSFTYNLVQAVGKLGAAMRVARNDQITGVEVLELKPAGMILSPGPGRPEAAGNMPSIFAACAGRIPVFGVCLGLQMIGLHFGASIVPAARLMHGKAVDIAHDDRTLYTGLTNPFAAGRYHSLAVDESTLPPCLEISAHAADGEIMGLRHREWPIEGVQFHPESILTPKGEHLIANALAWMAQASSNREATP